MGSGHDSYGSTPGVVAGLSAKASLGVTVLGAALLASACGTPPAASPNRWTAEAAPTASGTVSGTTTPAGERRQLDAGAVAKNAAKAPEDRRAALEEPAGLPPVPTSGPLGGDRPTKLTVPDGHPGGLRPLVVLLHGRGASGAIADAYLGLSRRAEQEGFYLVAPDGTTGPGGVRFWDATDACCNFTESAVDDVAYVRDLVRRIVAQHPIDPRRIYLIGHSNGAFLAERIACEASWLVSGVVAMAGSTSIDASRCAPAHPVHMLFVHGTKDGTIRYEGGVLRAKSSGAAHAYPGVVETANRWARLNGCAEPLQPTTERKDLVGLSSEPETAVLRARGCKAAVEHWRVEGAGHVPLVKREFVDDMLQFLADHPRAD